MILSQSFLNNIYSGVISSKVLSLLLIIFLWMALSSLTAANETDCGLPECKVKYSCKNEAKAGCEAINRALQFFKNYGYQINDCIHMEFQKKVTMNDSRIQNQVLPEKQVLALYDVKENCIKITCLMTDYCKNRKALGALPFDTEFYTSIITHEVAHRLYHIILNSRGVVADADHSFSEFIAYVTQIETMAESHKSNILSLWPKEELPSVFAINPFVWQADPNKFCVMAYRFFKSQPETIQQILDGTIKPVLSGFVLDY